VTDGGSSTLRDIATVARKEWMEIVLQRASMRAGLLAALGIPLAVLGIWLPAQNGPAWFTSPLTPVLWTWFPIFICATIICDAFAGERERHTLETLLASRLSDTSILFGKLAGAIGYGWGLALAGAVLNVVTVNVVARRGGFVMFPADVAVSIVVLSFLGASLTSAAGVLVSLRAASVRQAQQTLSIAVMAVFFGGGFGLKYVPPQLRRAFVQFVTVGDALSIEVAAAAVLAAVDVALVIAAMARFRRMRLILD